MSGRLRRGRVLIFAESLNDARSLEHLLIAANPDLQGRVAARPRPTSLTRAARTGAIRHWVEELSKAVAAYEAAGQPVSAVVVHRDADRADPEGTEEVRLRDQLVPVRGYPVVPVKMIESWWYLFPDAVESVRPVAWRQVLPRRDRDVEMIADPKGDLVRLTRKRGGNAYAEADSISIAEAVRRTGATPLGRSPSYSRFLDMARGLT